MCGRTLIGVDVLIVLAQLCLRAGGVDGSIGEGLAFLQAWGDLDAMHGAGLLVLLPGRAGDVSTDDSLDGKNAELAHLHTPVLQGGTKRLGDLGRKVEGDEVGAESRNSLREDLEPGLSAESEQNTLVRDALSNFKTSAIVTWW
jgi:hypothetical protein